MASVNLVYRDNGFGLSRDFRLLAGALRRNGCDVFATRLDSHSERRRRRRGASALLQAPRTLAGSLRRRLTPARFDLNILFEHVWPEQLALAHSNVALPNPEWFDRHDQRRLGSLDGVWAKSRDALDIFQALGCPAQLVGFTSEDRLDRNIARQRRFLHLAGGSRTKGTDRLLALWRSHPEWPQLTVLQHPSEAAEMPPAPNIEHRVGYLDPHRPEAQRELVQLQNSHLFHVCTSETDAWGHYLVEALGVGAVTLTVDAPPMNERIDRNCGLLVPYAACDRMALATRYYFDVAALERTVREALDLDSAALRRISDNARACFERTRDAFDQHIAAALRGTLR